MSTLPSLLLLLSLYCEAFYYGCGFAGGVVATEIDDSIKQSAERLGAFPFYIFQTYAAKLVFSLVVGCIAVRYLLLAASPKVSKATVSHILLRDSSEQGRKKLEEIKREIQHDKSKFALAAQLHSDCPSGKAKEGLLGSLSPVRISLCAILFYFILNKKRNRDQSIH
jgi:hypothetical protein